MRLPKQVIEDAETEETTDTEIEEVISGLKLAAHLCLTAHQYTAALMVNSAEKVLCEYIKEIQVLELALKLGGMWNALPVCKCGGTVLKSRQQRAFDALVDIVNRVVSECEDAFIDPETMDEEWKSIWKDANAALELTKPVAGKGSDCGTQ